MAITGTTLKTSIKAGDTLATFTAYTAPSLGTGVNSGNKVARIDSEWVRITDDSLNPTVRITRGEFGTQAVAHNALAAIAYGLTSDVTNVDQFGLDSLPSAQGANSSVAGPVTSYSVSGAITIPSIGPNVEQTIFLTKAGVAAMTLAAPAVDQDGLILNIQSNTAQAHTVTATGLLNTGTASVNVATFAAHAGAGVTLQAASGLWNVLSSTGITFS